MYHQTTQIPFAILYHELSGDVGQYLAANMENEKQANKQRRRVFIRLRDHYGRPAFRAFNHLLWIVADTELSARNGLWGIFSKIRRLVYGIYAENRQYRRFDARVRHQLDQGVQSRMQERFSKLTKKDKRILQQYAAVLQVNVGHELEAPTLDGSAEKRLQKALTTLEPSCNSEPVKDACHWLIALEKDAVKGSDLKAFDKWINKRAKNREAFEVVEHAWLNVSTFMK